MKKRNLPPSISAQLLLPWSEPPTNLPSYRYGKSCSTKDKPANGPLSQSQSSKKIINENINKLIKTSTNKLKQSIQQIKTTNKRKKK